MKKESAKNMNRQESDVLFALKKGVYTNQRILAEECGHSLGIVNRSVQHLIQEGFLDEWMGLTEKACEYIKKRTPRNAVILAAGFGMRMVPINMETPKALLEVKGETLIERLIKQLHQVGVTEIYVVVGFMKEQFEFLIDDYGVELIVNSDYAGKNNLHSLKLAADKLSNTYIVPCDIWCKNNPFSRNELYSWYMLGDSYSEESDVRMNRKMEIVKTDKAQSGNTMIGISYLLDEQAQRVKKQVLELCQQERYNDSFWEEALYQKDRMIVSGRVVPQTEVVEINTYEQLREIDSGSNQLKSDAIMIISQALRVDINEIKEIEVLKKGMTNRSFLFECKGRKYIMRIPGEGTDQLINRREEAAVYHVIDRHKLCDDIIYIDPSNGYKITEYFNHARVCDPECESDLKKCMQKLRHFHELALEVEHSFDIFGQIEFYESLWREKSAYRDYEKTKVKVLSLKSWIEERVDKKCLVHIDAVPDNFLFVRNEDGEEEIRLIDWEYAGMQDPHVDIAMFCIYSLYNKQQIDTLIDLYFPEGCTAATRTKIYCYISACGLLWSNWCEYKRSLGVEFGEYSIRQYRYAKEYYKIAKEEIDKLMSEEERSGC